MNKPMSGGKPEPSASPMPKFGMRWFSYNPAYHLAATLKMSAEEKASYYDTLNTALVMERRGLNPEADKMMDNAYHVSEVRRKAAERSWEARREDANAKQMQSKSNALPTDLPNRPTEPDIKPEPKREPAPESIRESVFKSLGIGNSRGDLKETIAGLSHEALPQWAANYCHEADPVQAVFVFKKAIRAIGPELFRRELDSFVAEVEAGEEPKTRGRAFNARIQDLVKAKIESERKAGA